MPQPLHDAVLRFFHDYAADSAGDNIPALVAHFADTFLAAGPDGAQPVRAADFALALPKRKQLFDKLGCRSTELLSVQPTPLDARYVLARTEWRIHFERPRPAAGNSVQDIVVLSTFLVDTGTSPFRILVYLAHEDIMALLRERGILTA